MDGDLVSVLDLKHCKGIPVAYTAHPSTYEELDQARTKAVIAEESIITSRGAGTATEFSLKIIERLCGNESAKEIASAICWSH